MQCALEMTGAPDAVSLLLPVRSLATQGALDNHVKVWSGRLRLPLDQTVMLAVSMFLIKAIQPLPQRCAVYSNWYSNGQVKSLCHRLSSTV